MYVLFFAVYLCNIFSVLAGGGGGGGGGAGDVAALYCDDQKTCWLHSKCQWRTREPGLRS